MLGKHTPQVEVTHVSKHGFWLLLADEELFLSLTDFPWFRGATIDQLCAVEWSADNHLYWPSLDIDLAVESIRNPSAFPLIASTTNTAVKRNSPKATRPLP